MSACHPLQSARIAPKPPPQCLDSLPVSFSVFCRKVLVRRDMFEKGHSYTYSMYRLYFMISYDVYCTCFLTVESDVGSYFLASSCATSPGTSRRGTFKKYSGVYIGHNEVRSSTARIICHAHHPHLACCIAPGSYSSAVVPRHRKAQRTTCVRADQNFGE